MKTLLFIFGTRPESMKMVPIIKKFSEDKSFNIKACVTGQHRQMLDQVLDFFKIKADFDLNIKERREIKDAGAEFMKWIELISNKNIYDDKIITVMIEASKTFKPGGYDGSIPVEWYIDEFKYIQKLLGQYRKEIK